MNATVLFEVVNETDISFGMKKKERETGKGNSVVLMGAEEIKGQHRFMLRSED